MSKPGEKYKSKKQMLRHEKTEGKKERTMEYGPKVRENGCMGRKCMK